MMHYKKRKMVILMIETAFKEVIEEARYGIVYLMDEYGVYPIRVGFNVVEDQVSDTVPNIYIKDKDKFKRVLNEYVSTVLDFYGLEPKPQEIKKVITYSFINITPEEMNCLEDYLSKYIGFYNNTLNMTGSIETSIGNIDYYIERQSLRQETPYFFKSYISDDKSVYTLPRISFGMNGDICEIYAIQNKDSSVNLESGYGIKVHDAFATINSGVKKYRNVTPSFVVTLTLFVSLLKEHGINKVKVRTPLTLRNESRFACAQYRLDKGKKEGTLTPESIEAIKSKTTRDDYNSTTRFINCFNRLDYCFENIYFSQLSNEMIINALSVPTRDSFLTEILGREIGNNGKISEHSSSKS